MVWTSAEEGQWVCWQKAVRPKRRYIEANKEDMEVVGVRTDRGCRGQSEMKEDDFLWQPSFEKYQMLKQLKLEQCLMLIQNIWAATFYFLNKAIKQKKII